MKYNRLAAAGLGLVLTAGLAACGSSGGAGADAGSGHVKLEMWTGFTGGDRASYDALVKQFNATHPDIQVTMDVQPWDTLTQKLPAAWATGQGPDIATPNFDPNVITEYAQNGALLPITNVGSGPSQVNVDSLPSAAVKEYTVDGKLLAVPANFATLQLYYNKKLFANAGVSQPPATVADFKEDVKKLTGNGVYGLALADHETINMWPILQWLDGSDIVDSNNCSVLSDPKAIASLTGWSDLVKSKDAPVGLTGAEADTLFSSGKAAMELNGPWAASGFKDAGIDVGIAPVPAGVDGSVTLASTAPLAGSAKTKHPKEVQEFLAWWSGKDAQKAFAKASGFPPARTDLGDDPDLKANTTVAAFAAAVPSARLYLPSVPNATKIDSDVYIPLIGNITRGKDVEASAKQASEQIDQLTGCKQ